MSSAVKLETGWLKVAVKPMGVLSLTGARGTVQGYHHRQGAGSRRGLTGRKDKRLSIDNGPKQGVRDAPSQLIAAEPKLLQVGKAAQCGRDHPVQPVPIEVQGLQAGQAGQLGRNLPGQLVMRERQDSQVGQAPQSCRYHTGKLVSVQVQPLQAAEATHFCRDLPG